jgi:hypothetical protein
MYITTDYDDAVMVHDDRGGYLLNLGQCDNHFTYAVCGLEMAMDYGRTKEYLESLAPSYRESK